MSTVFLLIDFTAKIQFVAYKIEICDNYSSKKISLEIRYLKKSGYNPCNSKCFGPNSKPSIYEVLTSRCRISRGIAVIESRYLDQLIKSLYTFDDVFFTGRTNANFLHIIAVDERHENPFGAHFWLIG